LSPICAENKCLSASTGVERACDPDPEKSKGCAAFIQVPQTNHLALLSSLMRKLSTIFMVLYVVHMYYLPQDNPIVICHPHRAKPHPKPSATCLIQHRCNLTIKL
jgi:hypothetical protein